MKYRLQQFMMGRHGTDDLGQALNILALGVMVLGLFVPQLSSLAMVVLIVCFYRMFSRNTYARSHENEQYLQWKNKLTKWCSIRVIRFKNRKMYLYFKCPSCKQDLRVPRGKGDVTITCPICKTEIKKWS